MLHPMLNILEVPTVRRQVAPISVETYHALGAQGLVSPRTELLRGVILKKAGKSPLHEYLTNRLIELIRAQTGPKLIVRKEGPLTLADSEPEPDITVVAGQPEDFRRAHPRSALLVVEVAISTVEMDRAKAVVYAEAGVPEFWLVLPEAGVIEVFTQPKGAAFLQHRIFRRDEILISTSLPNLRADVNVILA